MWPSSYSAPRAGVSPTGGVVPPWAMASAAAPARVSSAAASAVTARGIGESLEFGADRSLWSATRKDDPPVQEVVIASAARTAVGSYGKSLKDIPTTELGATAATAAIDRAGIEPDQVEQVVFGNVIHSAPEDMYMARVVGIKAGIPKETPALTVNRLCGTGVQAIVSAAQTIQTGEADVVLAGGAESMSRGPYWMPNARWGARMGEAKMVDPVVGGLTDPFQRVHMGITAENLAESHEISREQQDEFALESHRRAHAAQEAGKFDDEVVPVEVKVKKEKVPFTRDEHVRPEASKESMAKLKPVFKPDGTVTAGNASGMNDAGAAVVLMSAAEGGGAGRARPRPDPLVRLLRRRSGDHGHRAGPGHAQGARQGRRVARRRRRDRAERGLRRAGARRDEGPRARPAPRSTRTAARSRSGIPSRRPAP